MLDTISEVVKRGIETAQIDLERENAEKLWQEGILRHVPVVGTFVNWWSPPSKETGVRGRSLNLQAGKYERGEGEGRGGGGHALSRKIKVRPKVTALFSYIFFSR